MERFVADESVDFRIVTYLREAGFEVKSIVEENPSISDEKVLEQAFASNALLLTEDKDFGELTYRLKKRNKGIILIRLYGVSIADKIKKIESVMNNYLKGLHGKFTVISKEKVRIKKQ